MRRAKGLLDGRYSMNVATHRIAIAAALVWGLFACGIASADTVVMNFDMSQPNGEYVDNYYNGGCSSSYQGGGTTCGGPDWGVVWNGAIAGWAPNGIWENGSDEPSSPGIMAFLDANEAYMNVAGGFTTGFSFYYASAGNTGFINVYSGLNGSGTVLASLDLPGTASYCDSVHAYSCWDPIGVSFSGTAQSVAFGGTANFISFDNVTIGAATPGNPTTSVPEPGALGMFGLGALLLGGFLGLRKRFA